MDFKAYRENLGLTQQGMAARIGIPRRTWQDWELGNRTPPEWVAKLIEDAASDLVIRRRYNKDFDVTEYNCGRGWRTTLLGAMEEAGFPIKTRTLSSYLQSVAIMRGLDECVAKEMAERVESFFGVLEVPDELNPEHHV